MNLSSKSTYEDILNFKRDEIKAYLKSVNEKVSGSKDELARRAHDYNQKQRGIEQSVLKCDQTDNILAKLGVLILLPPDSLTAMKCVIVLRFLHTFMSIRIKSTIFF